MGTATTQDVHGHILAGLRSALERWYSGDPMGYADLFADDLTYFAPPTGGRLEGIEALRASYAPIQGKVHVPRHEVSNPKLQLHGDVGVLTYHLDDYPADGSPGGRWNATEVYRRDGDEWRIIHAHWSLR
ncbi:MAG: nuclear transport factor 2 family protein [Gemmatimonadaceae bacterium]